MDTEDRLTYVYAASKIEPEAFEGIDGPGRLDGANDRVLTLALDILVGQGMGEEVGGDVNGLGHGVRFGRFLLVTDSQGFLDALTFADEDEAVQMLAALEPAWDDREADRAEELDRSGETMTRDRLGRIIMDVQMRDLEGHGNLEGR